MNPNDLMLWLSAKGCGTWSRYRAAVNELQVTEDGNGSEEDSNEGAPDSDSLPIHHRLRLNLERLAHAEFFRKGFENGWRVVPPVLVGLERSDCAVGILCGARTGQLLQQINGQSANVAIRATSQEASPDRIEIVAKNVSELEHVASSLGLHFQPNAVRMLLAAVPPVDDWQSLAPAELPFGGDWEVYCFSAETLGWNATTADKARNASFGLFRFRVAYQPQYFIRLRGKGFKVPVQVGKYLVLKQKRRRVVEYDAGSQVLSIPVSCRPPLLVDRALTLCSGLIPRVECARLAYPNVGGAIAKAAASLLRQ
ncbi:MAG: hypothetical protein U1A77_08695 [Pirellulales bacterium]